MLKAMMNNAFAKEMAEREKNEDGYEAKAVERRRIETAERNKGRTESAIEIGRLTSDLLRFMKQYFAGVNGVSIYATKTAVFYDGLNPESPEDEVVELGSISAEKFEIEFMGHKILFVPTCVARPGGNVRCSWPINIFIDGVPYRNEVWEIDSYADATSKITSALTISSRVKKEYIRLDDDEYIEGLFKKAFQLR